MVVQCTGGYVEVYNAVVVVQRGSGCVDIVQCCGGAVWWYIGITYS